MDAERKRTRKPEALPDSYREVWEALSEADRESPSRQALARRLGVSTHTIQRILLRGDVPLFPETSNTRIRRAWTRIMTRLAFHLGYQPRRWIEMIGIPWDYSARKASEEALTRSVSREAGQVQPSAPHARVPGHLRPAESRMPGLIRIGIIDRPPFSQELDEFGGSFFEVFAGRLVRAVAPSAKLRFQILTEQEAISGLTDPRSSLDIAVGLAETAHRRSLGLEFVDIPGWSVRFRAITLRRAGSAGAAPPWSRMLSDPDGAGVLFLVPGDDVAVYFLAGQCGIVPERLLVRTASEPDDIARIFLREAEMHPEMWVVLVMDALALGRVERALGWAVNLSGGLEVEEPRALPGEYPEYRLGLGLGPGSAGWRDLLEAARDDELFGGSIGRTARLYAEVLGLGLSQAGLPHGPVGDRFLMAPGLTDFRQASDAFREMASRDLLEYLSGEVSRLLKSRSDVPAEGEVEESPVTLALSGAKQVLPAEWLAALHASAGLPGGIGSGAETATYCRSCSVSLHVPHNRGASDHYCRFCSDEHGHLKPRDEVQHLIAEWFRHWQGDLGRDEALRRAGLFMQAMPAWCQN